MFTRLTFTFKPAHRNSLYTHSTLLYNPPSPLSPSVHLLPEVVAWRAVVADKHDAVADVGTACGGASDKLCVAPDHLSVVADDSARSFFTLGKTPYTKSFFSSAQDWTMAEYEKAPPQPAPQVLAGVLDFLPW